MLALTCSVVLDCCVAAVAMCMIISPTCSAMRMISSSDVPACAVVVTPSFA
jgi:hypothetical protein